MFLSRERCSILCWKETIQQGELACVAIYPASACVSVGYVIGVGVHVCMYVPPQNLNDILVVSSPFQALVVDFSLNL